MKIPKNFNGIIIEFTENGLVEKKLCIRDQQSGYAIIGILEELANFFRYGLKAELENELEQALEEAKGHEEFKEKYIG